MRVTHSVLFFRELSMTDKVSPYISRGAEARTIDVKSIEGQPTFGNLQAKPLFIGEHMTFLEIQYEKGTGAPLHVHSHVSLVYVISGKFKTTIGDEAFVL